MPDDSSFAAIDQTWTLVQSGYPDAYANASAADKPKVQKVRDDARDAYYAALDKVFDQTDAEVQQLTTDLNNTNTQMSADLDALKRVVTFLNLVASAVSTATQLAALAG